MKLERYDTGKVLRLGAVCSATIALINVIALSEFPLWSGEFRSHNLVQTLEPRALVIASVLLGMCLGSQVAIFWSRRKRLETVFQPNLGRCLSAFVLALLAPIAVWGLLPFPFAWIVASFFADLISGSVPNVPQQAAMAYFVFLALPTAYIVSCLIISGVRSRWMRIALYGQVWLAAYGVSLLIFGCCTMNL